MKNLIFALIGVLYLGVAHAQVTVTFPAGNIASEQWVQSFVQKKLDSLTSISHSGTKVIPSIPSVPAIILPNCDRGPTIVSVTNDALSGLSIHFDGKNVFGIDYLLLGPVYQIITRGAIEPKSNTFKIGYPGLPDGDYHLTLTANTCTGKDSKDFTIKKK